MVGKNILSNAALPANDRHLFRQQGATHTLRTLDDYIYAVGRRKKAAEPNEGNDGFLCRKLDHGLLILSLYD